MKHLHRLAFFPPILLGFTLVWWVSENRAAPTVAPIEERRVAASYVIAQPRNFTPRVSGFGEVEPARVWSAVAQVAGRVVYVNDSFVRGGAVSEGEVLIKIARDDYELAVVRAEADIRSAEARVKEIQISEVTTKASLEIEREALALAEGELARITRLQETGTTSSSVVEIKKREVLAQQVKVQGYENTLQLLPAQLDAALQSVAVAKTAKLSAELDLARTELTAPFDGRVAKADVEISQFVGVGVVMGIIDGAEAAEIEVQMSPRLMAALTRFASDWQRSSSADEIYRGINATVGLSVDEAAATWQADVARISDAVDPETRSIGVIVKVPDPYSSTALADRPPLIKGMFVKVTLSSSPLDGVIVLPRRAIRDGRIMLADPDDRLTYVAIDPIFTADGLAVLAPNALPAGSRIIVTEPSPAIEGLLLTLERDEVAELRLSTAEETF